MSGDGDTDIFVANVNGTGVRNLTAGSDSARRVLRGLSPGGRMLAFDQLRVEGYYGYWSIELVPARGGPERTLVSYPGASAYDPAWSRDGRLLAFETCCRSGGVRIVGSDGSEISLIPDAADPVWLAGPRLAFLGGGDVQSEVATVKPDGSDRHSIVNMWELGAEGLGELAASPNGQRLAFGAGAYSGWLKVFTTVRDGLWGEISNAWSASWSPTSRRLVAVTSRGLVTARPDGSERQRFRATERLSPAVPSWSPDGTRIAFVAGSSGSLVVLNVRHRSLRVLHWGEVDSQRPVWSRDGRRLYYASPRSG